ncbi:hypothetical protein DFH06DRAFT_1463912 [Mycena polygramma]|nr:hypothetical protein DFH06DRAFT_1463912 [Mycena polygramma]
MSVVDPSDFMPQLVTYATLNIFATCGLIALIVVTLLAQGRNANPCLLNLELAFIIGSSTDSGLIWTGHARDTDPPFALCLLNGSATMSNIPLVCGAALAIVAEVWGIAMMVWHPRLRPVLEWVVWKPFLLLFPYAVAIPLFIAGLAYGLGHRSQVLRGSPFYCLINVHSLQSLSTILGAVFTFVAFVLTTWTGVKLLLSRRRTERQRFTEGPGGLPYVFVLRVMVFSVFIAVAFVVGILALTSAFDAVVPDIIVALCGVGVFFIFASAKPIVQYVCCRRNPRTDHTSLSLDRSQPLFKNYTAPEFSLTRIAADKRTPTNSSGDAEIHITRVVETHEGWTAI